MQCKTMHFLVVWNSFWIVIQLGWTVLWSNESQPSNDIYIFQISKSSRIVFFSGWMVLIWCGLFSYFQMYEIQSERDSFTSYFYVLYTYYTVYYFFEVIMIFFWKLIKLIFFVRFKSTLLLMNEGSKNWCSTHLGVANRCLVRGGFRGVVTLGVAKPQNDFPY